VVILTTGDRAIVRVCESLPGWSLPKKPETICGATTPLSKMTAFWPPIYGELDENKDNTSGLTPHGIPEEDPQ
jgi:hypothetical protein